MKLITDNGPPTTENRPPTTIHLGLTGDIACGKSTVARILQGFGATVLDADLLVRELYADRAFAAQVAALFPSPVLDSEGMVDRAQLGALVFADPAALRRLEQLVHPAVAALRDQKIAELQAQPPAIVVEAVKLLESGLGRQCDVVWCVTCQPDVQMRRLMETRGLTADEARARMANQPASAAKRALAGSTPLVMIENNGSLDDLKRQVEREWQKLRASRASKGPDSEMEC